MKVAILTMFTTLTSGYSLVNVVSEQLEMLLKNNIEVKMLVSEYCLDKERVGIFADNRIQWVNITNSNNGISFPWIKDIKSTDEEFKTFLTYVDLVSEDFVKNFQDIDFCFMHDILYQKIHLIHNLAIRKAQKLLPSVKFLSFTHSVPLKHIECSYPMNCLFTPMPNTKFIYPTESGLKNLSEQYNTDIENCYCVNNSINPLIGMCDEVLEINKKFYFLDKDIVVVYPGRLSIAKNFDIVTTLVGYIKKYSHKTVAIIFCDVFSSEIPSEYYKKIIINSGMRNGLDNSDIVFTSDLGFKNGVSRKAILDLFTLSNLFVFPSYSESFGLILIEAAIKGNYIVLNESVPALKEIGNKFDSYFMNWNNNIPIYDNSEKEYYIENAKNIIENMEYNPVIKAKTLSRIRYSNKWIFENELKPLLDSKWDFR